MKDKQRQRSRQMMEINLYRVLCIELIKIITASGIKLPAHVMKVVNTCFPMSDKINTAGMVRETRCGYCSKQKKCITGQYRFNIGGCSDLFKKKWWLFFKTVKNPVFHEKSIIGQESLENALVEAVEQPEKDIINV